MSIDDRGMAWVFGRVGDKTIKFLVDTGANHTILDNRSAAALGLEPKATLSWTVGPMLPERINKKAKVERLLIGGFLVESTRVTVLDLDPVIYLFMKEKDVLYGILGGDLLNRFDALVDYRNRTLLLRDGDKAELASWQGEWTLTDQVYEGRKITNPNYLAATRLTITGNDFKLTLPTRTQTGKLHLINVTRPKIWALTTLRHDGKLIRPDLQPPQPNTYELYGSYEWVGDRLRFTMPTAWMYATYTGPPKLESTATNKQGLFTWTRAKPKAAPPAKP